MPVLVAKDTCIGCGSCIDICPVSALSLDADGKAGSDVNMCIDCGACLSICPVEAITQE